MSLKSSSTFVNGLPAPFGGLMGSPVIENEWELSVKDCRIVPRAPISLVMFWICCSTFQGMAAVALLGGPLPLHSFRACQHWKERRFNTFLPVGVEPVAPFTPFPPCFDLPSLVGLLLLV